MFKDQAFRTEQRETGRIGVAEVGCVDSVLQQLAFVEMAVRINALFVILECSNALGGQELELGDADAVFAGNDTVQRGSEPHDACNCLGGFLQHGVIVGIDGDVGVHIAVTGVHMERDKHAPAQRQSMRGVDSRNDLFKWPAAENVCEMCAHFIFPRHTHGMVLQNMEQRATGMVRKVERRHFTLLLCKSLDR